MTDSAPPRSSARDRIVCVRTKTDIPCDRIEIAERHSADYLGTKVALKRKHSEMAGRRRFCAIDFLCNSDGSENRKPADRRFNDKNAAAKRSFQNGASPAINGRGHG